MVEADESDRSLLKLDPEIAVLTNAELDHHSTYASQLDLEQTFRVFMARAGDARRRLGPARAPSAVPAGRAHLRRARCALLNPSRIAVSAGAASRSACRCPGAHNAINAAGALTAVDLAGADAARGGRRAGRLPRRPQAPRAARRDRRRVPVYDDYAHHPTEVAAAIAAARTLAPTRLVAVFQPHLFSRTRALAREFGRRARGGRHRRVARRSIRRASAPRTSRASTASCRRCRGRRRRWAHGGVAPGVRRSQAVPRDDAARGRPRAC